MICFLHHCIDRGKGCFNARNCVGVTLRVKVKVGRREDFPPAS